MTKNFPERCRVFQETGEKFLNLIDATHNNDEIRKAEALGRLTDTVLELFLCRNSDGEYDYEHIRQLGLELGEISSDLLKLSPDQEANLETILELKLKMGLFFLEVFSRC